MHKIAIVTGLLLLVLGLFDIVVDYAYTWLLDFLWLQVAIGVIVTAAAYFYGKGYKKIGLVAGLLLLFLGLFEIVVDYAYTWLLTILWLQVAVGAIVFVLALVWNKLK